jgi:hypothetical protein
MEANLWGDALPLLKLYEGNQCSIKMMDLISISLGHFYRENDNIHNKVSR